MLQLPHIHNIAAIPSHNIFLVYHETSVTAYSLDLLGRVALQISPPQLLDASREAVTHPSDLCYFMKVDEFERQDIRKFLVMLGLIRCLILTKVKPSHVRSTGDGASIFTPPRANLIRSNLVQDEEG